MARKRKALFELPFSIETPRLTDPGLGIQRLVVRGDSTWTRLVTILDAPDHRLLRAGVMLAHRVRDGLGDYYLDAPTWGPWLPKDHSEPMGAAGDLPADLAELVRPFRRRAALGPVAAVETDRTSYTFKDPEDVSLGTLVDEKMTVRRNGLTISRFREVTLAPSPAMTGAQKRFLIAALTGVGAIQTDEFPDLVRRLGAPATGLTDYPEPRDWDSRVNLETFVSQLFAARLQHIVRADLALRASELARRAVAAAAVDDGLPGEPAKQPAPLDCGPLMSELMRLRHQVSSLQSVLEPGWREQVEEDLQAVLDAGAERPVSSLSERYFAVLDALVSAIRAPQLGNRSREQAAPVLRGQLESGMRILVDRCDKLGPESTDADWLAALVACRQLLGTVDGLEILFGKLARKLRKQLRRVQALLEPCQPLADWPTDEELATWSPAQVFEAGRTLQRAGDSRDAARVRFVQDWPPVRKKLTALA